jgi:CBS domain-containing protein
MNVDSKSTSNIYDLSIFEMLSTITVRTVLTPKNILLVQARENVETLLQRLRDTQLRCAVVYDTQNLFVGFVDALDVATYVLRVTNWSRNIPEESFKTLDWQGKQFASEISGCLMNISNGDPFQTITPDAILRDAIEILSRGVHRLAVVENGNLVNILSQWDVLLLVLARVSFLGTAVEKTISEVGLFPSQMNVFTVPEETDVVETLKFMSDNQITGVPLVDNIGKITGNFSATDMLNLSSSNFPLLSLSTKEFLVRIYGFIKPPVVCKKK